MNDVVEKIVAENKEYYERLAECLRELFDKAQDTNELQFAFSLSPEFRGMQGAGWNTSHDAIVACGWR